MQVISQEFLNPGNWKSHHRELRIKRYEEKTGSYSNTMFLSVKMMADNFILSKYYELIPFLKMVQMKNNLQERL